MNHEDTADEDGDSVLYFRHFNSWTSNADWTFHLPRGEQVQVVAVGSDFVAAATSLQVCLVKKKLAKFDLNNLTPLFLCLISLLIIPFICCWEIN